MTGVPGEDTSERVHSPREPPAPSLSITSVPDRPAEAGAEELQNAALESPTSSCYSPGSSLSSVAVALYKAGLQFENQGRLAGAIGLYRQAIKLHPGLDRSGVCLEPEEIEQEDINREQESNAGDMEGDVHIDRPQRANRRTWDAATRGAAAEAASSRSSSRRASSKRQDAAAAAAAAAATAAPQAETEADAKARPCLILKIPEHLLGKIVPFVDTYSFAKLCMSCKSLYEGLWRLEDIWREKAKATFSELPSPQLYGGGWKRTFFEAPRLRLDGVYISKCVYLRRVRDVGNIHLDDRRRRTLQQLQLQLQQQLRQFTGAPISQELINDLAANSPVIAVTYYRYLRFLPGNKVLVLRSEAEKHVAVAALKSVQARLEGKSFDASKAPHTASRTPALHGVILSDQVVLGSFKFDDATKIATLSYTGKPLTHGHSEPPVGTTARAAARERGHAQRHGGVRGPDRGALQGAPGYPDERGAAFRGGSREESDSLQDPSTPMHTAVLQLAHIKGGRWNYTLKWKSLSVRSHTLNGPDESFINVENENFRPFIFHRVISFCDYF